MLRLYPPRNYYTGGQKGLQDLVSEEAQSAVDFLEGPAPGLPEDFKIGAKFTPESLLGDSSSDTGLKDMMAGAYDSAKTGTVAEVYAGIVSTNQTVSGLAGQDQAVASDVYSDYAIAVAIVYGPPSLFLGKHPLATQVVNSWSLLNFG
jgi:hypothetical protein